MIQKIKNQIPNIITLSNLASGCLAIICFFKGYANIESLQLESQAKIISGLNDEIYFKYGVLLMFLAMIFDFLDGLSAKLLHAQSPLGAQLDSLSDLVTFGVAPGILFYVTTKLTIPIEWVSFLFLLIPIFSAYRLAKFNIDDTQTENFKGIPTPANALFWTGMPFMISSLYFTIDTRLFFVIMAFLMSFMMISNIEMFSLKVKNLKWRENKIRYIFIIISLALLILFTLKGISIFILPTIIITIYVMIGIISAFLNKQLTK